MHLTSGTLRVRDLQAFILGCRTMKPYLALYGLTNHLVKITIGDLHKDLSRDPSPCLILYAAC